MQARVEYIQTMKDSMVDMDVEGNEIKFFSSKFLVQKYLKLSDADLKLNDKMKQEEIKELNLAGDQHNTYDNEMPGSDYENLNIDYNQLSNMIVEKLTNKSILTEEKSNKTSKVNKDKSKKKKSVKSKENMISKSNKSEEE